MRGRTLVPHPVDLSVVPPRLPFSMLYHLSVRVRSDAPPLLYGHLCEIVSAANLLFLEHKSTLYVDTFCFHIRLHGYIHGYVLCDSWCLYRGPLVAFNAALSRYTSQTSSGPPDPFPHGHLP